MKLTTKGKFAVAAILDIAMHSDNNAVSLSDISRRQNISVSYLEQLFVKMRRARLVKSLKGPGGGYLLAREKNLMNIAQIINAVEDSLDARSCHGMKNCREHGQCIAHNLWSGLTDYISIYLAKITIADAIKNTNFDTKFISLTKTMKTHPSSL